MQEVLVSNPVGEGRMLRLHTWDNIIVRRTYVIEGHGSYLSACFPFKRDNRRFLFSSLTFFLYQTKNFIPTPFNAIDIKMDPSQIEALLDGPAGPPPPGVVPNLENPPNKQSVGRGLLLTCLCLATVAVILRLYTKVIIMRQFRASDGKFVCPHGSLPSAHSLY